MHLMYFDEVKYDPPNQMSYWMGGIAMNEKHVQEIEAKLDELAILSFGRRTLERGTEFHGIEICRGKGNFKGRDFDERMRILAWLLQLIADNRIQRIFVRIIPDNIVRKKDPADTAFMFLVELANEQFKKQKTLGMMFGDYDEPAIGKHVEKLSEFRSAGTNFQQGHSIDHIIDTVHFARSHHSRLIQLADVYLYCLQFHFQPNESPWRQRVDQVIFDSGILEATTQKTWPNQRIIF